MNSVPVTEFYQILQNLPQNEIAIDVRTHEERNEGYIVGTTHVPLDELPSKMDVIKLKYGKIYFQCRSGKRSADACTAFMQSGFVNVYNVTGGIVEWERAGFLVDRGRNG